MNEPEGLISLREAARRLGVGSHSIRKLVKSGELRGFRVLAVIRVDPLELRRYLRGHPATDDASDDHAHAPEPRREDPPR